MERHEPSESVTIDIGAGQMTVKMSTIVGIDKGTSPLHECCARAATIADNDAEGWRELGRWASKQRLGVQAREAASKVVAVASKLESAESCEIPRLARFADSPGTTESFTGRSAVVRTQNGPPRSSRGGPFVPLFLCAQGFVVQSE